MSAQLDHSSPMAQPLAATSFAGAASRQTLQTLLAEVNALALRLNQLARSRDEAGAVAVGGRGILQLLERTSEGQTVPQLARARRTSRQSVQMLVNRLHADGCVELVRNPAHKRSVLVRTTGRGRASLAEGEALEARLLDSAMTAFQESDLLSASRLLAITPHSHATPTQSPGRVLLHARTTHRVAPPAVLPEPEEMPVSLL